MSEATTEKTDVLSIIAIQTEAGLVMAACGDKIRPCYSSDKSRLEGYLFDGARPTRTYDLMWAMIPSMPTKCQKIIPAKKNETGYLLRPEFAAAEATPRDAPADFFGRSGEEENQGLVALYEAQYEEVPEQYEDQEFDIAVIATVDDFALLRSFEFSVRDGRYPNSTPGYTINEGKAKHQLIDEIFFPPRLLAARPTKLSSYESYQIIRNHIKDNIDGRYAQVTSDYDFCLTVEKRIGLAEPESYTVDVGRRKPKLEKRYRQERRVVVYKVAPFVPGDGVYQGYPECQPFEGATYRELEANIKKFLDELMAKINEPIIDCPRCKGSGVFREETTDAGAGF